MYDDSVRVPENLVPGKAKLLVELESRTGKSATAAELPVRLEERKP